MELVGSSDSGVGVTGTSNSGVGVVGTSNIRNGVIGKGSNGVVGTGGNIGVVGDSTSGYGGAFSGGLAPLRLEPSNTQGSPASGRHSVGELYVDNNGALYFCVGSGTPGTWKRVQLV
jgi:hypothetical protein